ncbi:MAG TPA: hypothetical protein VHD15_01635 [Hyphomicrobiales bacterium]|nr:hypothetical protein [Hyphomicrobiales bacterium]
MLRIEITPEQQEAARRRYEENGESLKAIAPSLNMAPRTLFGRAREWGWVMRGRTNSVRRHLAVERAATLNHILTLMEAQAAAPPSAPPPPEDAAAAAVDRAALTARIRRAVEQELAKVERLLRRSGGRGALDGSARTLATLVKTLAELRRLETTAPPAAAEVDDGAFADLDTLRLDLARRLEALCQEGDD